MKTYRSPREVIGEVKGILAEKPSPYAPTPLDRISRRLGEARHYLWIGIYLVVGERPGGVSGSKQASQRVTRVIPEVAVEPSYQPSAPEAGSAIVVPIRVADRVLGIVNCESERTHAFDSQERVLLEQVAELLARFLVNQGKYLVQRARETAGGVAVSRPETVPSIAPSSVGAANYRRAAAGEKARS